MQITNEANGSSDRPFLKWAGGKTGISAHILSELPMRIDRYIEPFLGGGSIFFGVAPKQSVLADTNEWLVDTYRAVKKSWRAVEANLKEFRAGEDAYYRYRELDPKDMSTIERAALLIYLNRTCYRGVFRVNASGRFNVPYGAYTNRPIYRPGELEKVARSLAGADLRIGDFEDTVSDFRKGDFVYFDPPYFQPHADEGFVRYNADRFSFFDHLRLRDLCVELDRMGVKFALSHVENEYILDLYKGFKINRIEGKWHITPRASRKNVLELLIKNY